MQEVQMVATAYHEPLPMIHCVGGTTRLNRLPLSGHIAAVRAGECGGDVLGEGQGFCPDSTG
jgi:hypothetical protein